MISPETLMSPEVLYQTCVQDCKAMCCKVYGSIEFDDGQILDFKGKDCPLLVNNLCLIYDNRPKTCREFPTGPTAGCLVWPSGKYGNK